MATTSTITIDGNLSDWLEKSTAICTSAKIEWYVTWDTDYLYIGVSNSNGFWGDGAGTDYRNVQIYIDTGPDDSQGADTTITINSTTNTLPFF